MPPGASTESRTASGTTRCCAAATPTTCSRTSRPSPTSRTYAPGDAAQIARPIDALGLNYYRRYHVRHRPGASADPGTASWPGSPDVELVAPPGPKTAGGWAIEPEGLREALVRVHEEYDPPPLFVDEGGRRVRRRTRSGRCDPRRRSDRLSRRAPAVGACRASTGCRSARLLRLVPPRQLRVGRGLCAPVRNRARGLRDAAPHSEGERPLVRRCRGPRHPRSSHRVGIRSERPAGRLSERGGRSCVRTSSSPTRP